MITFWLGLRIFFSPVDSVVVLFILAIAHLTPYLSLEGGLALGFFPQKYYFFTSTRALAETSRSLNLQCNTLDDFLVFVLCSIVF